MRFFRNSVKITKQIAITPPSPRADRHGVAIAACIKNEQADIADWVAFHRAVGVRHFYLYDNGSTDKTVDILRSIDAGDLTIIPWAGRIIDSSTKAAINTQIIAWATAIANFGGGYRWMAFIDADEFLLPKTGSTVEEALTATGGFPNISLPWHMFGTNGHDRRPEGSILYNFTRRGADPMSRREDASNFKCIVDPCAVAEISVHHFSTQAFGELTANDMGKKATRKGRKAAGFYSAQHLQLNHYYTKSREELEAKLARGPASVASHDRYVKRVLTAVRNIEAETMEDRAMIEFIERYGIELPSMSGQSRKTN